MSGGMLVVGASQAGLQTAVSLRELGYEGPVRLVGAEPYLPYQRPPLSKAFLAGDADEASLQFRNEHYFESHDIEVVLSTRITEVSLAPSVAIAEGGREFSFDKLALTTGASPRRLNIPGVELQGVQYLRGIDDALTMRDGLDRATNVVVVGGGFIGLEAAAVSRKRGKNVTVVEALPGLLSRVAAPVMSEFFLRAHQRRGTHFRFGSGVTALRGESGHVTAVELADGALIPADLVIIGIGVVPCTELAEQLGAQCQGGIVVDGHAQTSLPDVVAAGDCAIGPNPLVGAGLVRLESVQNAVDQAKVAAHTMLGKASTYDTVPWFWSDQGDLKLHMAGLSTDYDDYVIRGDVDSEHFSVLYYRDGKFLALNSVNRVPDYVAARGALGRGAHIPPDLAVDADIPLRSIIQEPAASATP